MRKTLWMVRPIALAVSGCFGAAAYANPTGPQVVNGTASFARPDARTLNVTNSPNAIINWQGFSIGAGEATKFIQQSTSSAVLNRVVGADISKIAGQLSSNGRVFLINPAGIVIGAGREIVLPHLTDARIVDYCAIGRRDTVLQDLEARGCAA